MKLRLSLGFQRLVVSTIGPGKFYSTGPTATGRTTSKSTSKTVSTYCVEQVKKYDRENYLCSLLLPEEMRPTAFALKAFNIEVSRVQDRITDPKIGEMRLKFWENTVKSMFKPGSTPKNPTMVELNRVLEKTDATKSHLNRLVASRRHILNLTTFPTVTYLVDYLDDSVSTLYYILLENHQVQNENINKVASHVGIAYGLVITLRSIEYNASRFKFIAIPSDLRTKHSVNDNDVLRLKSNDQIKKAVREIADLANKHLVKAESMRSKVPKQFRKVFLQAVCARFYLQRLRQLDYDVFNRNLQSNHTMLPLMLWWNAFLNKY